MSFRVPASLSLSSLIACLDADWRKESGMKIDGRCHCGYITYAAEIP